PLALAEDATVAGVERLPLHEAHPVAVAAHDVEPERETAGRILGRGGDGHRPLAQLAGENLAEEILLVAEVMVEHPLVDAGAAGDAVDAGARETFCRELSQRGGKDALSRARGMPRVAPGRSVADCDHCQFTIRQPFR